MQIEMCFTYHAFVLYLSSYVFFHTGTRVFLKELSYRAEIVGTYGTRLSYLINTGRLLKNISQLLFFIHIRNGA